MKQFERRLMPTHHVGVSLDATGELCLVTNSALELPASVSPPPAARSACSVTASPGAPSLSSCSSPSKTSQKVVSLLPCERPLFSPLRSFRAIKEDQLAILDDIGRRHVGELVRARTSLETIPPSSTVRCLGRRPSFEGLRTDVVISENPYALALTTFIDSSLTRIFPPPPPDNSGATIFGGGNGVDHRQTSRQLLYEAHDPKALEIEIERAALNAMSQKSGNACRTLPPSPFPEPSMKNPPPQTFHPPPRLPALLSVIQKKELMHTPFSSLDPDKATPTRDELPLQDDERDAAAFDFVRQTVHRNRAAVRPLAQRVTKDTLTTSSAQLFRNSQSNRRAIDRRGSKMQSSPSMEPSTAMLPHAAAPYAQQLSSSTLTDDIDFGTKVESPLLRSTEKSRRVKSVVSFGDFTQ